MKYVSILLTKDMELNRLVPQQGPLSQEAASWTEWGVQETQVEIRNEKYNKGLLGGVCTPTCETCGIDCVKLYKVAL